MNSQIENLLLESLPGNNLTPRDLKSTDRFTAEENRIQKKEGEIREQTEKRLQMQMITLMDISSLSQCWEREEQSEKKEVTGEKQSK